MSKVFLGAVAIGSLMLAPVYAAAQKAKAPAIPHGNPHTTAPKAAATTPRPHGNPHTTTSATTSATTNSIATKIASKPQLASRLGLMLPAGMTLATASSGFKNQGQFIAALHVSENLHIPFADLKRAMTGTNASSLGQAIQTLRPSAHSTTEAAHAETQATTDLRPTTTTTPKKPRGRR